MLFSATAYPPWLIDPPPGESISTRFLVVIESISKIDSNEIDSKTIEKTTRNRLLGDELGGQAVADKLYHCCNERFSAEFPTDLSVRAGCTVKTKRFTRSTIVDAMITVLIPKNITAVINFITVIWLIPLNYKTATVTVTVILINSGNFQDCNVSVPGKTTDSGATEHSNIITVIATLQSCN